MPPRTSAYLEQIIQFLMPYFLSTALDIDAARSEIIETLASYGTRARSEILKAALIIAFGMSALDTLADAKAMEMSPSMRLRFRGCANGLNRSVQQNEKTLAACLRCDQPDTAGPVPEPADEINDHQVQEAIQQARAKIDTYRSHLANAGPVTQQEVSALQDRNKRLWGSAMAQVLADMGMAPAARLPEVDPTLGINRSHK